MAFWSVRYSNLATLGQGSYFLIHRGRWCSGFHFVVESLVFIVCMREEWRLLSICSDKFGSMHGKDTRSLRLPAAHVRLYIARFFRASYPFEQAVMGSSTTSRSEGKALTLLPVIKCSSSKSAMNTVRGYKAREKSSWLNACPRGFLLLSNLYSLSNIPLIHLQFNFPSVFSV